AQWARCIERRELLVHREKHLVREVLHVGFWDPQTPQAVHYVRVPGLEDARKRRRLRGAASAREGFMARLLDVHRDYARGVVTILQRPRPRPTATRGALPTREHHRA